MERNPKKKAYMKLHTSVGDLNLELHADITPRTVENFLLLAEEGYYKDTIFHRCIRHFMIQVRLCACVRVHVCMHACVQHVRVRVYMRMRV